MNARKRVPALATLASEVWEAEGAASRKIGRPCRKAFQRRCHMLQRMLGEAMDGRVFRTATDVIRWAIANDPYLDYATVFKRIKAIRQQQGDLAADLLSMASPIAGFSAASRSAIAGVPRAGREGRAGPVTATPDEDTAVRQC